MPESLTGSKPILKPEAGALLLEYALKALLVAGLCELVLYRLISRLGMHLSKVAREYVTVEYFLRGASSIGFALLNFSAILVFLVLGILLFYKMSGWLVRPLDRVVIVLTSAILALTVVFLLFPPGMPGSIVFNALTLALVWILVIQYCLIHPAPLFRAMIICYGLGVSGWLYYQVSTTTFGWLGLTFAPPLVHEISRAGEALMVLATGLVFAVYSGFTFRTSNRRQRKRAIQYTVTWAVLFLGLLVVDRVLEGISPALASQARQAGQGIGWIFQMGMGYTFFLPFAFYMAGLLFWSYAVIKQVTMGRRAGYGLAFMFIAGYALQLSHLTMFVVVGLLLLVNDGRVEARERVGRSYPLGVPPRSTAEASGMP
jgi:hypothetical protein